MGAVFFDDFVFIAVVSQNYLVGKVGVAKIF